MLPRGINHTLGDGRGATGRKEGRRKRNDGKTRRGGERIMSKVCSRGGFKEETAQWETLVIKTSRTNDFRRTELPELNLQQSGVLTRVREELETPGSGT